MNTIQQTLQNVHQMVEDIGNEMFAEYLDPKDVVSNEEDNLLFYLVKNEKRLYYR
jgi:hypothetical protein